LAACEKRLSEFIKQSSEGFDSMKTKYQSQLIKEKELQVAISPMTTRFRKLCTEKQAHQSQ
jgi:hypothetical protein